MEGAAEVAEVAQEHAARRLRRVHPLVRVDGDRVGVLRAGEQRAQRVGEHDRAAVRGVDVEPRAVLARERRELRERVDRARRRRARRGRDGEREHAGGDVARERLRERVGAHPLLAVDRDRPDGVGAEAEHVRRPADDDVGLLGGVDGDRAGGRDAAIADLDAEPLVARALQPDEVRHRAAGHDHPAGALGEAEAGGQPARQVQLDLGGAGAEPVAAQALVEAGGEELRRRARDGARAGDVGEVGRVAHVQRLLEGELAQVGEHLGGRHRLLGHRAARAPPRSRRARARG